MGSSLIVEADPSWERSRSVIAGLIDGRVSPFALQCLDEALRLAVRAWTIRAGPSVLDSQAPTCACEVVCDIAAPVVTEDLADTNAVHREPLPCPLQESDRSGCRFIGKDLDVGDAAVVVDGDVDELPSLADLRSPSLDAPTGHSVTWPNEPSELLDVDMDQLTRPSSHVAIRRFRRLQPRQPLSLIHI